MSPTITMANPTPIRAPHVQLRVMRVPIPGVVTHPDPAAQVSTSTLLLTPRHFLRSTRTDCLKPARSSGLPLCVYGRSPASGTSSRTAEMMSSPSRLAYTLTVLRNSAVHPQPSRIPDPHPSPSPSLSTPGFRPALTSDTTTASLRSLK